MLSYPFLQHMDSDTGHFNLPILIAKAKNDAIDSSQWSSL